MWLIGVAMFVLSLIPYLSLFVAQNFYSFVAVFLLKDADWKVVSTNKNNGRNRPQAWKQPANVLHKDLVS